MEVLLRTVALCLVLATTCGNAEGGLVFSLDDPVHGVDSITRDVGQSLDFLDVTKSSGLAFNTVTSQFGGDFAGFRYATTAEVITLINNFGFLPAIDTSPVPADTFDSNFTMAPLSEDLAALVDLLGITDLSISGVERVHGITGDLADASSMRLVLIDNLIAEGAGNEDQIVTSNSISLSTFSPLIGSFLVRDAPISGVPEPSSLALFCLAILGFLVARLRRCACPETVNLS